MNVIYFMLPVALLLGTFFLVAFTQSVRQGQYDDLETPAHRILVPDEHPQPKPLEASHVRK